MSLEYVIGAFLFISNSDSLTLSRMKHHPDLYKLDILNFAQTSSTLGGELPLSGFERLKIEDARPSPEESVSWTLKGEQRKTQNGTPQIWLHLKANTHIVLTCQRCLELAPFELAVDRHFRFVDSEETALAQDDENEEDLLALDRKFNALELIEDELIMNLPLVPRHQACHNSVLEGLAQEIQNDPQFQRPNPFAALEKLKKRTKT
jgi:uncharacterized protein